MGQKSYREVSGYNIITYNYSVQSSGSRRQFAIATAPVLNGFLRRQQQAALTGTDGQGQGRVRHQLHAGFIYTHEIAPLAQVITFLTCNQHRSLVRISVRHIYFFLKYFKFLCRSCSLEYSKLPPAVGVVDTAL